ncbi:hypothetical protein [Bradyrhizobium sp. USDA 4452]
MVVLAIVEPVGLRPPPSVGEIGRIAAHQLVADDVVCLQEFERVAMHDLRSDVEIDPPLRYHGGGDLHADAALRGLFGAPDRAAAQARLDVDPVRRHHGNQTMIDAAMPPG